MSTTALELLAKGNKLPDILTRLVPVPVSKIGALEDPDIAAPVVITEEIGKAIEALKLRSPGHVALTVEKRQELTQAQLDELSAERDQLDILEAYIKSRKEAHRAMVFNHLDVELEAKADGEHPIMVPTDAKGHYMNKVSVRTQGGKRKFDRQIAEGKPFVTAEGLQAAENNVEDFDHDDYLACTTMVRVLDEERTLIHMRNHPGVVEALRYALQTGETKASLYHRKG